MTHTFTLLMAQGKFLGDEQFALAGGISSECLKNGKRGALIHEYFLWIGHQAK